MHVTQPAQIPTGTVTLLFTDVEGSTRLWEAEPELMASALRRHDEILRRAIRATRLRIQDSGRCLLRSLLDAAAEEICAVASDVKADLIIVGNKGMIGMRRVLGSVPNSVAHHAPCSVLIACTT